MIETHVRTAAIMGVPWSIRVRGPVAAPTWTKRRRRCGQNSALRRRFSPFRPDSEVCRLRRYPNTARSAELDEVLELAEIAQRATGGDFDVRGGGHLDPSGIVKGWAAARAARALDNLRVDYYFNAGGDLGVRTVTDSARPWRIGIEHPGDATRLITVVEIVNGAVATSGSAHRGTHLWDPRTGEASRRLAGDGCRTRPGVGRRAGHGRCGRRT